jgi:uncharacterized protein YbjT (DUF2867 family)
MKIVITGSLGNISKPLAIELLKNGHHITIISSKIDKQKDIEALGAIAAIGTLEDVDFLTTTSKGAEAVYCMIPPNFSEIDQAEYYSRIGRNYATAISKSNVKRVVELSSYGAHLEKGTGYIVGSNKVEKILNELADVSITHIRPGYFYYNLFNFIKMIKATGKMMANYGDDDKLALVSPTDIAAAIATAIVKPQKENDVRYVVSEDLTCNEIAGILGKAIDKPDLKWITITSEQMQSNLESNGVPKHIAFNLVELGEATHSGALREDYEKNKIVFGEIKLENFANEFVKMYNS